MSLKLVFKDDSILIDGPINSYSIVMSVSEKDLMKRQAEIVCKSGGDILEIGFGMGISADFIQSHNPKSHTIVESHPQVIERLRNWSKNRNNVTIIEGDWLTNVDEIVGQHYDGIFFDTHLDKNQFLFRELVVDKCLKDGGVFTWFSPKFPLFDGVDNTYGYNDIIVEEVQCGSIKYKLPYIFSNHQLK